MNLTITPQEHATILAALRLFQEEIESNGDSPIIDHFYEHDPLTSEEIDTLCERIN